MEVTYVLLTAFSKNLYIFRLTAQNLHQCRGIAVWLYLVTRDPRHHLTLLTQIMSSFL